MKHNLRFRFTVLIVAFTAIMALPALSPPAKSQGQPPRDMAWFLKQLTNLDRLPYPEPGVISAQFSSYDRASQWDEATQSIINNDANGDSGNYLRVDMKTNEGVMAEIEGPGCIVRLWSANPEGKIRFYLDGAEKPTLEMNHKELYSGNIEPFRKPLVWGRPDNPVGNSYVPIPFARSCKITADSPVRQYYHIGYKVYPKGTPVKTFHLPLSSAAKIALEEACRKWENLGVDPSRAVQQQNVQKTLKLIPGASETVKLQGPAEIREFRARIQSDEKYIHRKVHLAVLWDGEQAPAIDAPLGDFFGVSFSFPNYHSLPLGVKDGEGYCYWRMPFQKSAAITLTNRGLQPVQIDINMGIARKTLPPNAHYFRAKWRRELNCMNFDYPILECQGSGTFVGCALYVDNVKGGWWGEGDEKIYVDGQKFPSFFGTGSEDYFGDAWGIRYFENAFHGCSETPPRKISCYRWHIADDVPFLKSYKMTIENYSWLDPTRNDYASMAYWYTRPHQSSDFFQPVPDWGWMPLSENVVAGASEAETFASLPAGAALVENDSFSMGRAVKLPGPAGTQYNFDLHAGYATAYVIQPGIPAGTLDADYTISINGQRIGERNTLNAGSNTLSMTVNKDEGILFDYIKVDVHRGFITRWLVLGPFDNSSGTAFLNPLPPEMETDMTKTFDGQGGPVSWKRAESSPEGKLDLKAVLSQAENIIGYAAVDVVSPDARRVRVYAGSDDGIKVWVNGDLVHTFDGRRGAVPDQDVFEADLKPGANRVLAKVWQGPAAWELYMRFDDPDGGLQYKRPGE